MTIYKKKKLEFTFSFFLRQKKTFIRPVCNNKGGKSHKETVGQKGIAFILCAEQTNVRKYTDVLIAKNCIDTSVFCNPSF